MHERYTLEHLSSSTKTICLVFHEEISLLLLQIKKSAENFAKFSLSCCSLRANSSSGTNTSSRVRQSAQWLHGDASGMS